MARRVQALVLAGGVAAVAVIVAVAVALSGGGGGPQALPVLGLGGGGGVAESAALGSGDASTSMMRAGGIRYEVSGDLEDITGGAQAWSTGRGEPGDRLGQLAAALGVDGDIERTEHGWAVVGDGRRHLEVHDAPGLPWSYWHETVETVEAGEGVVVEPARPEGGTDADEPTSSDGDVTTATIVAEPPPDGEPAPEPERPADLPSRDEAVAIALGVMRAAGVDPDAVDLRVDDNFTVWSVTAAPVVGGLPTYGMETSVSVGSAGEIAWGNGWLGALTAGDEYPLIGTDAAVERLIEQGGGTVSILPADGAEPMIAECPPEADCVEPEPVVLQVTGVRLGLWFMPSYEGEQAWLVPAYLFEIDGGQGGEAPVVGVADEHVVEPTTAEPEPARVEPDGGAGQSEPGYPGP